MRCIIARFSLCFFFLLLIAGPGFAQGVLPDDPAQFITELTGQLTKTGSTDLSKEAASSLGSAWNDGSIAEEEKVRLIQQVNIMLSKKYPITRTISSFLLTFVAIKKAEGPVTVSADQFLEVNQQCILNIEQKRIGTYLSNLRNYLAEGKLKQRRSYKSRFFWKAFDPEPKLYFIEIKEGKKSYQAPVVRINNTELQHISQGDSTKIFNTSGDFNLISGMFLGVGGLITWEKMGLPAEDVYVVLNTYKTNLNYGSIEADSALFFYKGLLERPLKGKFEDKNLGYRSINKANFPAFKSYDGGVVIENFIPNIRYEGGFSLRGIRKVGSAYDIWVDYVPEPAEEGDFVEEVYLREEVEKKMEEMYDEFGITDFEEDESYDTEHWEDYGSDVETDDNTYDDWEDNTDNEEEDGGSFEEEDYGFSELPEKVLKHVKAKLEIKRGDSYVMRLMGEEFILDMDRMVGKNLETSVILSDNDSLFHPAMDLLYSVKGKNVTLKKPRRSQLGRLPFLSSYHEFFLYFESINWDLDTDKLNFTAFIDKENKLAAIESFSFYNKGRFNQFRGVLKFNPIGAIYRFAVENPGMSIFSTKILEIYNLMNQQTAFERMLPLLEGSGFIRFDRASKEIFPQQKLFDWAMFARNKKDYDAIQLTSKVDTGSHALMSVDSKELEIRGCQFFSLSDSQFIRIVPADARVRVRKNRELKFGGTMAAGKLNFYGADSSSFTFDYESYKVSCDSLDSLRFVLVRNPSRDYVMTPLQRALRRTVFEGVSGAVHIDAPNNKSGLKRRPHFPIFDSYTSAFVYWDRPNIQQGIYHRDSLYFSLDPFVLDSLEDFDETKLNFDGEFFSSEIFPRFRQSLVVMPDNTLGFRERAPENGYYIYDNKGLFYKDIFLDGKALWGKGETEILDIDITVKSDSFIFHFDSVMATIYDFHRDRGFRSGSYYPEVDASEARYVWYTKENRVELQSIGEPIKIFGGEADFEGALTIRPEGMIGNGVLTLGQVQINCDSIIFNEMDFSAPLADFSIIDQDDPELYHFVAEDVDVKYDVYAHATGFESKATGNALAYFPIHQYRTSLARGAYTREFNELKLEGVSSYVRDNYFLSTSPEQDSLKFNAKESYYKVDTRTIEITGVPYIYVADATVTPDKLEVTILENGLIKKLENAIIEADQETKLHRIYDAAINIYSSSEYEGSGKYNYIEIDGKAQYINFNNIQVNSDTTTVASGEIPDVQQFYLTERIRFRGKAELDASRRFLAFAGEVKIESENPAFKGTWFDFKRTVVNPDSVFIPIPKRISNREGDLLTVGLNYVPENRYFYSNFLQKIREEGDRTVISASGGLTFDRRTKEFRIGSREKLTGQSYKGTTVSFNDDNNTITSHGLLRFPGNFPKNTTGFKLAGSWKDDLRLRKLSTDLFMAVSFDILPKDPLKKLSENLLYLTTTNPDVDYNQRSLQENVSELLDEGKSDDKNTDDFLKEIQNAMVTTDIKLAKRLPQTLLLSGVNFNFSREYKSLYSDAEVGLIGLGGETINKKVPARIVYKFGGFDAEGDQLPDRMGIYLEVDEFNWLFLSFEGEVIRVISSYYDDFNVPLQAEVDKRKKEDGYRFEMGTEDEVGKFKQDFVKKYIIGN